MLSELRNRAVDCRLDVAIACLLTLGAFAVRIHDVGFNSLSEDETAKWEAIQEYRQGHFVGVNSEHPMVLKVLAWGSLTAGARWNRVASLHSWPTMSPEGWLRFPNVLFGAATSAILFLFCRRLIGLVGGIRGKLLLGSFTIGGALNRLAKEETPLTFFTLLACYLYCRAQQADSDESARRWYDLSAIGFGLAFASQYILHLLGLNALAWFLAGKMGLNREPSRFSYRRFFLVIFLTLILVNPVILFPHNFSAIVHWLHHDGVKHSGYDFDGTLYVNFASRLLAGVPWYFYFWLLLVKTPIPILAATALGSILLLRDRKTLASCFFLSFVVVQLAGLSICGAKWIRYSLSILPFLFLAGGYAVQQTWNWLAQRRMSLAPVAIAAVVLFGWPLLELHAWAPYYPFYLNAIGGGAKNITRYFAPDEVSEFDSREVAQQVCPSAPARAKLATGRPMSMTHYLEGCGRSDIRIIPLFDPLYAPQEGDLIVLEPSRRFFETQRFFDAIEQSGMSNHEIQVGPVLASTIYKFDSSMAKRSTIREGVVLSQSRQRQPSFNQKVRNLDWASVQSLSFWPLPARRQ
jgi:hypothetical protein